MSDISPPDFAANANFTSNPNIVTASQINPTTFPVTRPDFDPLHLLDTLTSVDAQELGRSYSALLDHVEYLVPPGRPRSIITTYLQEAFAWTLRGLADKASK